MRAPRRLWGLGDWGWPAILKMSAARLRTSTGSCGRSSDQPPRFWIPPNVIDEMSRAVPDSQVRAIVRDSRRPSIPILPRVLMTLRSS